jgi:hypothetical protein
MIYHIMLNGETKQAVYFQKLYMCFIACTPNRAEWLARPEAISASEASSVSV